MCQLTNAARWVLGIRPYMPKTHYLIRYGATPTGARGVERNGTASGQGVYGTIYGLTPEERRSLEELAQQHRLIRQIMADAERRRARGQG
jgi:hypothetical protein